MSRFCSLPLACRKCNVCARVSCAKEGGTQKWEKAKLDLRGGGEGRGRRTTRASIARKEEEAEEEAEQQPHNSFNNPSLFPQNEIGVIPHAQRIEEEEEEEEGEEKRRPGATTTDSQIPTTDSHFSDHCQ